MLSAVIPGGINAYMKAATFMFSRIRSLHLIAKGKRQGELNIRAEEIQNLQMKKGCALRCKALTDPLEMTLSKSHFRSVLEEWHIPP